MIKILTIIIAKDKYYFVYLPPFLACFNYKDEKSTNLSSFKGNLFTFLKYNINNKIDRCCMNDICFYIKSNNTLFYDIMYVYFF